MIPEVSAGKETWLHPLYMSLAGRQIARSGVLQGIHEAGISQLLHQLSRHHKNKKTYSYLDEAAKLGSIAMSGMPKSAPCCESCHAQLAMPGE